MRKFNHWETLKVVVNVLYIASFITLVGFSVSAAMEDSGKKIVIQSPLIIESLFNCENCDEID